MKPSYFSLFAIIGLTACSAVELTSFEKELLERPAIEFREEVYPASIPRAFDVHRDGCPVCGDAIKKHGMYSWIFDYKKPFKLQCPECKTVFPDNDFEAYRKTGDKALLTGKYVDDGWGYEPEPGKNKYWFVAYYHYWRFYRDKVYLRLAEAYKRTGEPGFAIRSIAMVDKYAEQYETYDYNKQCRYAAEVYPNYQGRIVDLIQMTFTAADFANVYIMVKPLLDAGPCEELRELTGRSNEEIIKNIEDNLLRGMARDIMDQNGKIHGNFGMCQKSLLSIAKALNDPSMNSWVTDFREKYDFSTVPLDYAIYNNIFSDGAPLESPGYNNHWVDDITLLFRLLKENGVNEFERHPAARHLFNYGSKMYVCNRFSQSSGDSSNMRSGACFCASADTREYLYQIDPSPLNARLLMIVKSKDKALTEQLKDKADWDFGYESKLLPAYGCGSLQNGNRDNPTAAVLAFHNYYGHKHNDLLHFEIFAEGTPMMPDFGYPDSASADDPELYAIFYNTYSHNTVVVDSKMQETTAWNENNKSQLLRYDLGQFAQQISAEAPKAYQGLSMYRRQIMTCETAPGKTIFFDVFRIKGGKQHDWFLHSAGETFNTEITLEKQDGGTFAGTDIPYGRFYDSPVHEEMLQSGKNRNFGKYHGSGYQYLTNVQRGKAISGTCIELPVFNKWLDNAKSGATLKLYPLEDDSEIIFSEGHPPYTQRLPQKKIVFVTRRRIGENLNSVFGTIYETVSEGSEAMDISEVMTLDAPEGVCAARITFKDGRILYVFNAEENTSFVADGISFSGESGSLLLDASIGKGEAYVAGEGEIVYKNQTVVQSNAAFHAKVTAVNLNAESVTFDQNVPLEYQNSLMRIGKYAYRIAKIEGNVVYLHEQSSIQGRARVISFSNQEKTAGKFAPIPFLGTKGMSLYTGENKEQYVGRLKTFTIRDGSFETEVPLMKGEDYWFSQCGPGEDAIFTSSASASFILE